MNAIVAVDNNWGIGKNKKLLFHIPEDMKYFKEKTTNKVIIMGRKTLESLPNGKPLKDRINIVVTRDKTYRVEGAIVVNSLDEVLSEIEKYNDEDVFVIGGGLIYVQLLSYCQKVYVTKVENNFNADIYFPNLDNYKEWNIIECSEEKTFKNLKYKFVKYIRRENKKCQNCV